MAIPFLENVDLSKNQFLNAVLQQIAGDHGSPVEGIIWYDTAAKAAKFHDGTSVQTFGVSGGGGDADTLDGNDSAYYLSRSNHTGTQLAATISDFDQAVNALLTGLASEGYVDAAIAALADSAPATLDTLNELAAALGDDPNFATTITNQLSLRTRKFAATVGDGSSTAIPVVHNLGTQDALVYVRRPSAPFAQVLVGVEHTDANTITIRTSVAEAANSLRVTVIG